MRVVVNKDLLELYFAPTKRMLKEIKKFHNKRFIDDDPVKGKHWSIRPTLPLLKWIFSLGRPIMTPDDAVKLLKLLDKLEVQEKERGLRDQMSRAISAPAIPEIENALLVPPRPYQWVPVHYALMTDGCFLLGDDMGSGKSLESLMIANHPRWRHKPVLIVTTRMDNFADEVLKFVKEPHIIIDGPLRHLNPRVRYYICNYHRLKHLMKDPDNFIARDYVKNMFTIWDEAHNFKNTDTLRFKFTRAICQLATERVFMTGTPMKNRTEELYALLTLLIPGFMSWHQFHTKFCGLHWTAYGKDTSGNTNSELLNNWLFENVMVRREKSVLLPQLPPIIRQYVPLKHTPVRVESDCLFSALSLSAEMKSKDPDFLDYLENVINEAGKVGIFAHHKVMLDALETFCKKRKIGFIRIDGKVPERERLQLAKDFATNPQLQVAILSINAAGEGLNNLQRSCQVCVFVEHPWTPGGVDQCESRFHRDGVPGSVLSLRAIYSNVDDAMDRMLLQKASAIKRVISVDGVPDHFDDDKLLRLVAQELGISLGRKKKEAVS